MSWTTESSQIMAGDEVVGSDGDKVGTVAEVQPTYIVVEKGFFFPTALYVPLSAVTSVGDDEVRLSVSKDDMGRVIGKGGKVANSIRTLLRVAAEREGKQATLDVVEPE